MKLYTPGNGLFETHVTWEDIEKDMQRELHTSASFGPKKSARNIADGIGFMSRIVLIDPDWQNVDKQLPARFIVKILTQLLMAKLTAEMGIGSDFNTVFEELQKTLHNGEVSVYNHLINYGHENFPIPKIYFMKKFSESNPVKGYIIMEYLENFKTMKIYNNVTVKAVKEVLAAIAIMEAMSLKFTPEEKEELTRSFEQFHKVLFKENVLVNTLKTLRTLGDGRLCEKVEKMEGILNDVTDPVKVDQLPEILGNSLNYQLQAAHMGCPATDVATILIFSLSGKDRQQHWEELLEHLHVQLKKEIGDMKMPYNFEQLKESYRQYFPFAATSYLPFIGPVFEAMSRDADEKQKKKVFDRMASKRNHSSRLKLQSLMSSIELKSLTGFYLDVVLEKTECLLDDTIYYYERSKKKAMVRKISQEFDEAELVV